MVLPEAHTGQAGFDYGHEGLAVPFFPFDIWVSLLKLNSRKKDTFTIEGLLGNLVVKECSGRYKPLSKNKAGILFPAPQSITYEDL